MLGDDRLIVCRVHCTPKKIRASCPAASPGPAGAGRCTSPPLALATRLHRSAHRHPGPEPWTADAAGYVETQIVIQSALDELRADHRRIVEIVVFEARSAADACAEVEGMTPDNAYQIVRRFRVRLRQLLEDDNG